jgi:hypothetical protein
MLKNNVPVQETNMGPLAGAKRLATAYRRWRFFRQLNSAFAAMTSEERADYDGEVALWDNTLMDGLEDEDWSEFRA